MQADQSPSESSQPSETAPKELSKESSKKSATQSGADSRKPKKKVPDFAPHDLTDGREPLDWQSHYQDSKARLGIRVEAAYLAVLFIASVLLMGASANGSLDPWLVPITDHPSNKLVHQCAIAWLAGTFGGTLFAIKWLYHSVAKKMWHEDRRLWRMFTPHLSGGLGVVFLVLAASGVISIIDKTKLDSDFSVMGLGFIVGYFSDSASGKLAEVAETLFGSTRPKQ